MGERNRIFNLRYSDSERELWRAGAAEAGMNLTEWIRFLIGRELTEGAVGGRLESVDRSNGGDAGDRSSPPFDPNPDAPSVSSRLAELPAVRAAKTDFKPERKK